VTPDELGDAWRGRPRPPPAASRASTARGGRPERRPRDALLLLRPHRAHHATRAYGAGTILGSGTVSNEDPARGISCLAERRTRETLETGKPVTPFLTFGDRVQIEMRDAAGQSIFGTIDQTVTKL
jgi:fumarylacetoacetate (FAA) hydrolase